MRAWLRVGGLFAAVVLAALLLKVLPPLVVLALLIAGIWYLNHALRASEQRATRADGAALLGLRAMPEREAALAGMPFALCSRGDVRAEGVMVGERRGLEVTVFDLVTTDPVADESPEPVAERRFTCAFAQVPLEAPHFVAEPLTFLTPDVEHPMLAPVALPDERLARFDIRCDDPAFAEAFLDDRITAWLAEDDEATALELRGSAALVYRLALPQKDRDLLIASVERFRLALPASRVASDDAPKRPDTRGVPPSR